MTLLAYAEFIGWSFAGFVVLQNKKITRLQYGLVWICLLMEIVLKLMRM